MRVTKNFFLKHGFVKPGDLVFDVGVREGKFTDVFLDAGARVLCVEPFPENVAYMREKYGEAITVIEAAVSDAPGWGTLHYSSIGKLNATLVPKTIIKQFRKTIQTYDTTIDVALTTLDELMEIHGTPSFIKLDIEGSEYKALCGMTQPVRALSFEFGMGYIWQAWKCLSVLVRKGYEFNYVLAHHGEFELPEWCGRKVFKFNVPEKDEYRRYGWGNVYARLKDAGD